MNQQAVILVDDDYNDGALIQRAFLRSKVLNPMIVARSGEEAIEYLGGHGKYTNRARDGRPGGPPLDPHPARQYPNLTVPSPAKCHRF
jgi:hypothetical protein